MTHQDQLNRAVNSLCSCGGDEPGRGCLACEVWHRSGAADWDESAETSALLSELDEARENVERLERAIRAAVADIHAWHATPTRPPTYSELTSLLVALEGALSGKDRP